VGGNWPDARVAGGAGVNRTGGGAKAGVHPAGRLGDPAGLPGAREIAIGYGHCSGQEAVAHFGLGVGTVVDVEVVLPHAKGRAVRRGGEANRRLLVGP
jgi:hypothetical protein